MPRTKREAVARKNVRIPKPLMDEVDRIVREGGLINRQQLIESAIRERVENAKPVEEREAGSLELEPGIAAPSKEMGEGLLNRARDTFLAHAIVHLAKGENPPANHLDLKLLEKLIRLYLKKRARREGRKIVKKQLDELTEKSLKYHQELLEGLTLLGRR